MEFRLTYDGWLPPESRGDPRSKEKHDIRRTLSAQLKVLWETHPRLARDARQKGKSDAWMQGMAPILSDESQTYFIHPEAKPSTRMGRSFLPLINEDSGVGCSLDILFMRRDPPGSLIKSGGDIDNRIKVLFDALRMPRNDSEIHGDAADDPNPFLCLLEDDRLITDVRVTTDRLLRPKVNGDHDHNVSLIVHVRSIVLDPGNLGAVAF